MASHTDTKSQEGQPAAASHIFRKNFQGYQKITDADYLEHGFLFKAVHEVFAAAKGPVRVLDLGCGDAENISKVLSRTPELVSAYTGVDMSETAVADAFHNVTAALGKAAPVAFHLSDMISFLRQTKASYDIVTAAFSLHHLTTADKTKALEEIHRLVAPVHGRFVLVDPFRMEDEDLVAYRQRATEVGGTWTSLEPEQRQNFIKHMQDYDIMEPHSFFDATAKTVGFKGAEVVCQGVKGFKSCVTVFET